MEARDAGRRARFGKGGADSSQHRAVYQQGTLALRSRGQTAHAHVSYRPEYPEGLQIDGFFMGNQVDDAVGDNGVRTGAHTFFIARASFNSAWMNCKAAVSSSGCGDTSAVAPPVSVLLAFTSEHLMFQLIQLYP